METPEIHAKIDLMVEHRDAAVRIAGHLAKEALRLADGDGYLARVAVTETRAIVDRIDSDLHEELLRKG